jgi:hypothetical protein
MTLLNTTLNASAPGQGAPSGITNGYGQGLDGQSLAVHAMLGG